MSAVIDKHLRLETPLPFPLSPFPSQRSMNLCHVIIEESGYSRRTLSSQVVCAYKPTTNKHTPSNSKKHLIPFMIYSSTSRMISFIFWFTVPCVYISSLPSRYGLFCSTQRYSVSSSITRKQVSFSPLTIDRFLSIIHTSIQVNQEARLPCS